MDVDTKVGVAIFVLGVSAVVMKNWLPFVFGPALAMDRQPLPVCLPALPSCLNAESDPASWSATQTLSDQDLG